MHLLYPANSFAQPQDNSNYADFDSQIFEKYKSGSIVQTLQNRVFVFYTQTKGGFYVDLKDNSFYNFKNAGDISNYAVSHTLGSKYVFTIGGT